MCARFFEGTIFRFNYVFALIDWLIMKKWTWNHEVDTFFIIEYAIKTEFRTCNGFEFSDVIKLKNSGEK